MHKMKSSMTGRGLRGTIVGFLSLVACLARAAAPGITGPTFDLTAADGLTTQPDGASIYTWGYGCNSAPTAFVPATVSGGNCPTMQLPGPTLVVKQGDTVKITLHNNLPAAAGNTSIIFPGFTMQAYTDGVPGVLTQEAAHGSTVTYTFVADTPGTHSYYSGTQADLQVEMGLYGALIVLPNTVPAVCSNTSNEAAKAAPRLRVDGTTSGEPDFRLTTAAYNNPEACYDREYLFQFSEMDSAIHRQVQAQSGTACASASGCLNVQTEPYHPEYFLINGRSMPDDMDPNYAAQYPNQPYNGNPHMHPGELTLLRIIGQGRLQHPFHEHANHVRILARDGNMMLTQNNNLAGPLLFTTTTTPGMAMDGIFQFSGKNLNWDIYGHTGNTPDAKTAAGSGPTPEGNGGALCIPDANGFYTSNPAAPNYHEWCADHLKPLEAHPFGDVGAGGPVTLPDPNILTNGSWYGGSPYLGPDATGRAVGSTPIPPSGTVANSPGGEAGFAFMWHSHNEREITTNNIFPGGMMMMMLVDPWVYSINEAN